MKIPKGSTTDCYLCGSSRHLEDRCNLRVLAAIQEEGLAEEEQSADLAEELERLYPGVFDSGFEVEIS